MPLNPAAVCIIFNPSRTQILLVKRKDVSIWVLPGGGIDTGESPDQAAIREAYEETGYQIKIDRQSGEYLPINRLAALTYVYVCHILEGHSTLTSETSAIEFFPLDALPKNFFIVHRDWLNDSLQNPYLVRKKLDQITYWATLKFFFKHPLHLLKYAISRFLKKHS